MYRFGKAFISLHRTILPTLAYVRPSHTHSSPIAGLLLNPTRQSDPGGYRESGPPYLTSPMASRKDAVEPVKQSDGYEEEREHRYAG